MSAAENLQREDLTIFETIESIVEIFLTPWNGNLFTSFKHSIYINFLAFTSFV